MTSNREGMDVMEWTDISPAGQWFNVSDDKNTIDISNLLKIYKIKTPIDRIHAIIRIRPLITDTQTNT